MHLYLLGYRGSGKTTVAHLLAQALDQPMVDTDDWIEYQRGQTISQIFSEIGETGFRDLEQTAVAQVSNLSIPSVVALGGGAVLRPANQQVIRATGRRVWLDATPELLHRRISSDYNSQQRRPDLTDRGGLEEVTEILALRRPIYASMAELTIQTDDRTPDQIADEILLWIHGMNS